MMPSLDHCISNSSEMTTLTNTLEVFDVYKHREDKDSDEESFHLPLDDDESDTKVQETARNGSGNDTEEEILNKFDTATPVSDSVDSQLEESLLDDDDEDKKSKESSVVDANGAKSVVENGGHVIKKSRKIDNRQKIVKDTQVDDQVCPVNGVSSEEESSSLKSQDSLNSGIKENLESEDKNANVSEINEINGDKTETEPSETIDETAKNDADGIEDKELSITDKDDGGIDTSAQENSCIVNKCNVDKSVEEKSLVQGNNNVKDSNDTEEQKKDKEDAAQHKDTSSNDKVEKNDDSNDSSKQNEDCEDLFDISIIRDAEEDNAESAYNEANAEENHVEDSEEYDERTDEKMEDECVNEKTNNEEEEDEEMDIDKQDQLKGDDVDIEEGNLNCDATKDSVSDGESETGNKTDLVQKTSVDPSECRLDEVTGALVGPDDKEINVSEEGSKNNEDSLRNALKRPPPEEIENGGAKKSRIEQITETEAAVPEKSKEKLPLKSLSSLTEFMKSKKLNKRLSMYDIEEFCVQKICEGILHESELGDHHHQLKLQEQLIETMRKEMQQLTKQVRDLEIVNKKLMNDLKQQTATQKPLNPLKITRSVGLQVKFTPSFEANLKRRQPMNNMVTQKIQTQTTPTRGPRVIPNTAISTPSRQVVSPQKPQQVLPKAATPLLSQALQSRRPVVNDNTNKIPNQTVRTKPVEPKTGSSPSASVIDLTDEDDKKDKNKNTPTKMVPPKNIAVPLRTTPMRVNTTQGIRLTTSQGKVSPITSVVTSSTPQVMYVVQSSPQNVLSPLGPKAVVVNFQSANGVLTSALNGSAVSVIPKQGNTIQLKTVSPKATPLQNNKVVKLNKHPAPLPAPPVIRVASEKPLKPIPPKPHLTIRKTETGIILQWKMPYELEMYEVIASYQLYAYQETSALPSTDMWRKVGDVKALALPMACTLTQFADKNKYYFAVRPVDIHKRIGMFSEPEEISL